MRQTHKKGDNTMIMNLKTIAKIHSLGGDEAEITVIEKVGNNNYIVDYNGVRCHAIFNIFVNRYFVDDVYGRIEL
jgi:hypothetical protein